MDKVFLLRLSLVRELSNKRVTVEELEKILQTHAKELDKEYAKLMIADLVTINGSQVELSRDGRLLLELIR